MNNSMFNMQSDAVETLLTGIMFSFPHNKEIPIQNITKDNIPLLITHAIFADLNSRKGFRQLFATVIEEETCGTNEESGEYIFSDPEDSTCLEMQNTLHQIIQLGFELQSNSALFKQIKKEATASHERMKEIAEFGCLKG